MSPRFSRERDAGFEITGEILMSYWQPVALIAIIIALGFVIWPYWKPFLLRFRRRRDLRVVYNSWKSPEAKEWMSEFIRYFSALGFFKSYSQLDENALADKIMEKRLKGTRVAFNPLLSAIEVRLLCVDRERLYKPDLESNIIEANQVYVKFTEKLARISRGAFEPEQIKEIWKGENGPILLEFVLDGKKRSIVPKYLGNRIDIRIISTINDMILPKNVRFEISYDNHHSSCLIVLSPEEKENLIIDRNWKFEDLHERFRTLGT